ncbi:hypothetical protein [Lysinibacter sp. HNR]|uniref:hypothetical protein n=1 Tax=Lysinibacter sp. HNR TaxID=3031408 RepID=UPI00243610D1|nr:hypothetical protein [Lysinibacter sp. HNR]WGD37474.1 hypothetical protein FrondiHNR_00695 [Lysinibacter sp. HNR]
MKQPFNAANLTAIAAATVLGITFFSQHPNRSFDRFRAADKLGFWLPNWRFFAPEPAQNDYHLLHRTLDREEKESPWQDTYSVTPRKVRHIAWFPDRRTDKGLFDVISEIIPTLQKSQDFITTRPAYRILENFIRHRLNATTGAALVGFQFMIVSSTGYEYLLAAESADLADVPAPEEILISPFISLEESEVS